MRPATLRRSTLATLGVVAALALLAWTFREVELDRIMTVLGRPNPALLLLILPPYLLALSMESWGFGEAIRQLGFRLPFGSILLLRLKTEAISQTLPLGQLWCDSVTPSMLKEHGVPLAAGVAAVGARKYLLILSQAWFLLFAFVVGHQTLAAASQKLVGSPIFQWLPLAAALVVGSTALLIGSALHRGAIATLVLKQLLRFPSERLRSLLFNATPHFSSTDATLRHFFSERISLRQLGPFLLSWTLESCETWLILRLLGVEIGLLEVISFEVLLTLARNVVFMVPAGLGVQDLGYLTFFGALGISDPVHTAAAFSILKRGKELCWACIGYSLFALSRPISIDKSPLTTS